MRHNSGFMARAPQRNAVSKTILSREKISGPLCCLRDAKTVGGEGGEGHKGKKPQKAASWILTSQSLRFS